MPDAKTILKIAKALGSEVITDLHQRIVDVAKQAEVTDGRRFRIDTTVVETNVHSWTDPRPRKASGRSAWNDANR